MLLAAATLSACQSQSRPTVSVAEARKITTEFQGSSYTPAPRTITDIERLLDENETTNWTEIERDRRVADSPVPAALSAVALARFYRERGTAAMLVGRYEQAVQDLRRALQEPNLGDDDASGIYANLSHAEFYGGTIARAYEYRVKALNALERKGSQPGDTFVMRSIKSSMAGTLGRLDEAIETMRQVTDSIAAAKRRTGPWIAVNVGVATIFHGRLLITLGRYDEAEAKLRDGLAMVERMRNSGTDPNLSGRRFRIATVWAQMEYIALTALAESLLHQDRLGEAEVAARAAVAGALARFGRYSPYTAQALNGMGKTLIEQGRFDEAQRLGQAILGILDRVGVDPGAVLRTNARADLGAIDVARGRWAAAGRTYGALQADLRGGGGQGMGERIRTDANYLLTLIRTGRAGEAAAILAPEVERKVRLIGDKHYVTAEFMGLLAMARAAEGAPDAALAGFRAAVPVLLQRSRAVAGDGALQRFRRERILEAYLGLLVGRGLAEEAFPVAGALKGGTVQAAVAATAARAAARDPDLADLVRREQDARRQVAALYALLSNAANAGDRDAVQDLRGRIDRLRGARAALAEEIERRFPDYAALVSPRPPTLAEARAVLQPGEALVVTFVGPARTYVWAAGRDGAPAFAAAPLGREDMAERVDRLRAALAPEASTLGDIPAFDVAAAHDLYRSLLAPVETGWKSAENLLVVAHGPLGHLPLSLLPTRAVAVDADALPLFAGYRAVPWLARTHAVTNLPSVAALRALRAVPPAGGARRAFAGFGDPWFRPQDAAPAAARQPAQLASRGALALRGFPVTLRSAPRTRAADSADLARLPRLPETADELNAIAVALSADPGTSVFTGRRASEGAVKSMDLSEVRVLAFATHGLVPGDLDGLTQPALALSAPGVTGETEDGLLTLGEILGLRLDADWVVLSACNTGAADGAGAEAVSGLGRAFFYAGSRALLVSNWPVETTSARLLTTKLFQLQAGEARLSRAQALRRSMVALIDGDGFVAGGKAVFSYAHPIFWAPFSVVGDGGGAAGGGTAAAAQGEWSG
ncbi:MAG: CHAT domain-containing protein [Hyphomicrobiales bacterium]|nr:CHAT domain-containing protein [Hyphomicrobiales bacterium]